MENNFQIVTLDSVVDFIMGQAPHSSTYNFDGDGELLVKAGDFRYYFPEPKEYTSNPLVFGKEGDVFICVVGATSGKVNLGINASITRSLAALRPKKNLDQGFLFYFLKKNYRKINQSSSGSAQGILNKPNLSRIKIPLPDLKTQQKIAAILAGADTAQQKRKQATQLTEQFLQSAFIELFGDPVKNEKGWVVKTLEEVCNKISDGTHFSPPNLEQGEYKYVTAKNIKKHGFDLSNLTYIDEEHHKEIYRRCNPEYGDVLYIKDGVTTGIAMVNTLHEEFSMLSSVALFKPSKKINSVFLTHYLNNDSVYLSIRNSMGGAAITRLTVEKLKRIRVILPSLSEQKKFASLVAQTEKLRSKQRESARELENLFQSLMQKYFG